MVGRDIDTEAIVRICRAGGATQIALFGSVARGENTPDSDVDVLVRFEKPISLLTLVRLERELAEALGRDVDLLTEAAGSPYLRERIEREKEVLFDA